MGFEKIWNKTASGFQSLGNNMHPFKNILLKAGYFIFMLIVIPPLLSTNKSVNYTDVKIGSVATKKVVAPFNFFILKTQKELDNERNKVVSEVPYFFDYNNQITAQDINSFNSLLGYLKKHPVKIVNDTLTIKEKEKIQPNLEFLRDSMNTELSPEEYQSVSRFLRSKKRVREVSKLVQQWIEKGIADVDPATFDRPEIAIIRNDVEEKVSRDSYTNKDIGLDIFRQSLEKHIDKTETDVLIKILHNLVRPNIVFNQKRTADEVEHARSAISLTKDMVYENERIVDANERITDEIYQKLLSLESARVERSKREGNFQPFFAQAGKIMLLTSILFIVGLYLFSFRKKIFADNNKLLLITIVIILQAVTAAIISGPLNWPVYVIPTTVASMLLAILIDSGIGFVGTVAIGLILGGIQGGGFDITLLTIVSGIVSIYAVHEIRNRNQLFRAMLYITLAYLWIMAALTFLRFDTFNNFLHIFAFNLLPNAIFAPFITYMLLGVFEKVFDITTDVRLLELSDLNHPLLKELSLKAPGTFHHSMVVGNLAEAAAKEIGENALLARVGCYFHDIGKMEKPEYFVENQMDAKNLHNALKPHMSALILISHVKGGVELAQEHNLPQRICDFISEHHGTSLMYFFYKKAQEQAGENDKVDESDFRYPGPKPQSKITGIAMLADTVEAASRTLKAPNPSKIRAYVESLVQKKFEEGQLDDCDLTFRELRQIISAFLPILHGVFQHRIEYPDTNNFNKGEKKGNAHHENGNRNIQASQSPQTN